MGSSNIIPVGRNDQASFMAFGDDSHFNDTLAYAFAIVERGRVGAIEQRLSALKDRFKIPQDVVLHCRVLFSGHQREKAGLSHLTRRDIERVVSHVVRIMNQHRVLVRYSVCSLAEWKAAIGDEIELLDAYNKPAERVPVNADPKGILTLLAQACFAVPPDGSEGPTASQCQIVVSGERTMVRFVGRTRKRADLMYSGFSDIGAPDGQAFQLDPTIVDAADAPLLQLADVAAYICSHAWKVDAESAFFKQQHAHLRHWLRKIIVADANHDATFPISA